MIFQYLVQMLDQFSPPDDQRVMTIPVVASDDDQAREVARGMFRGDRWIPTDVWVPCLESEF